MTKRMFRGDAPKQAQVSRLTAPSGTGRISITILGSGKFLEFDAWSAATVAAAWNASVWPEFAEVVASVSGADVLLTSKLAGRPFYVSATVGGQLFGNEVQVITPVNVTGGTATCTWKGQTTDAFEPTTTTANELKSLFEAFDIVDPGELIWTGQEGGPWTVEFAGRYSEQNVPLIVVDQSDLEGGTAAQNEKQRLSGSAGTFQLRRPDTLETTSVLSAPVTAADVHDALADIGYATTCTGGPLALGESATEHEWIDIGGDFNATELSPAVFAPALSIVGLGEGDTSESTGYIGFAVAQDQGVTIESAIVRVTFAPGSQNIPGMQLKAVDADNQGAPETVEEANAYAVTTASTAFDIPATSVDVTVDIDATAILQEIVDRGGFANGNNVVFLLIPPVTAHQGLFYGSPSFGATSRTPQLFVTTGGSAITIEWTGADAATDIPQLIVVPSGGYEFAPTIATIQNGHPATDPEIIVETLIPGGESLVIRDDKRSRGPNHWDDPLNWESDDGTFRVPEEGDKVFVESGRVDLLYHLRQRSECVAMTALNRLRMNDKSHWWNDQAVRITTTGTLPGGLVADTTYYVVNLDGPYLQLSATRGGSPIDLTTAGTGVHTLGVKLVSLDVQGRWQGKLGLSRQNTVATMYWEYRERSLIIWCPTIKLGAGGGQGSNRTNLDTGKVATFVQAIASGGQIESNVNAVLWCGQHADNSLEVLSADLGIAIFPEESATFGPLKIRAGSVTLGRFAAGASLDKTGGTWSSLGGTIAGEIVAN